MSLLRLKTLLVACFSLFALLTVTNSFANENAVAAEGQIANAEKKEGDFNVTETILEHIKDDHSWHLWGHTSIHLPVILKTSKGFEVFSSEKFVNEHHEPIVYKGNFDYKLIEGKTKIVDANGNLDAATSKQLWDFSITKNVASLFISVFILLVVLLSSAAAYKKTGIKTAPK